MLVPGPGRPTQGLVTRRGLPNVVPGAGPHHSPLPLGTLPRSRPPDTMASSMTPAVASGLSESRGPGTCPVFHEWSQLREKSKMHEHHNSPRKLRRRSVAAALAAAVAASVFLSVPSAQANAPSASDPPNVDQMPAPTPGFPLPTKHTQKAYDPAADFTSKWTRADAKQIAWPKAAQT